MKSTTKIRIGLGIIVALQVVSFHVVGQENGGSGNQESKPSSIQESKLDIQDEDLLYIGVHHEVLFRQLDFLYDKRIVGDRGVGYVVHKPTQGIYDFSIGVYQAIENAQHSFNKAVAHLSMRPPVEQNTIGSEFVMTGIRGDGGAIIVREGNICISFGWRGEAATARATAETVVDLIQGDRSVAPIGVFGDSVKLNNPKARVRNADRSDGLYILPAEFSGGKDPNSLLLGASSRTDRFYAVSRDEDDGSILIDMRGKSKPETLQLFIATEENVITIEKIELDEIADTP